MPKLREPKVDNSGRGAAALMAQPEPEETVETEQTEQPEVKAEEPEQNEGVIALQKQIEELTKARDLERQRADQLANERAEAARLAQEREQQVARFQRDISQSRTDAIASGIAAATAEAESASRDIEAAFSSQDGRALADAQRRLARAEANLAALENGKAALELEVRETEERAKLQQQQQPQRQLTVADQINQLNVPQVAKNWLHAHPDSMTDPKKANRLNALHNLALAEGLDAYSPEYLELFEEKLGYKQPKQEERDTESQRTSIVSAPVSREVPSGSNQPRGGKITLTQDQRAAAKIAGISEADYAKQLQRLNELKANGQYVAGGN